MFIFFQNVVLLYTISRCKGTKIFSNMQINYDLFIKLYDFWTILYVYIVYCLTAVYGVYCLRRFKREFWSHYTASANKQSGARNADSACATRKPCSLTLRAARRTRHRRLSTSRPSWSFCRRAGRVVRGTQPGRH